MSFENVLLPKLKYDKLMARLTERDSVPGKNHAGRGVTDTDTGDGPSRRIRPTPVKTDEQVQSPSDTAESDDTGKVDMDVGTERKEQSEFIKTSQRSLEEIYDNHKDFMPPGDKLITVGVKNSGKLKQQKKQTKNKGKTDKQNLKRSKKRPYSSLKNKWISL